MHTNSTRIASCRSSLSGHSRLEQTVSDHVARNGGKKRWLLTLFCALVVAAAGQVGADSYTDFNRAIAIDDAPAVTRLLERGMDPNTVDEKGEPALMAAARHGSLAVLKALLRARAKVNAKNAFGDTPIMIAALNGRLPVIKLLREAGAEINHPGWTALQYAAVNGHNAVIDYLLSTGADLALVAPNGVTPLMLAVRAQNAETVKLLISYGFDVSVRNDKGETALAWAQQRGYKEIEQLLREAGATE